MLDYVNTFKKQGTRYPTYQFHGFIKSEDHNVDEVFRMCVYKFIYWVRSRLVKADMGDQISEFVADVLKETGSLDSKEAENEEPGEVHGRMFPEDKLCSFTNEKPVRFECVYMKSVWNDKNEKISDSVWSLRLSEDDPGETDRDGNVVRSPDRRRTFDTEIAISKKDDCVEFGTRVMVTDMDDYDAPCSIWRTAYMRMLEEDPCLKIIKGGFIIGKTPFEANDEMKIRRIDAVLKETNFDIPILIVADSGYEYREIKPEPRESSTPAADNGESVAAAAEKPSTVRINLSELKAKKQSGFVPVSRRGGGMAFRSKSSSIRFRGSEDFDDISGRAARRANKAAAVEPAAVKRERVKREVFNLAGFMDRQFTFALPIFVPEDQIALFNKITGIGLEADHIEIFRNSDERMSYKYSGGHDIRKKLYNDIAEMLKTMVTEPHTFGNVMFYKRALRWELNTKIRDTGDMVERISDLEMKNRTLKSELDEKINEKNSLEKAVKEKTKEINNLKNKAPDETPVKKKKSSKYDSEKERNEYEFMKKKAEAYDQAAEKISFLEKCYKSAVLFPTRGEDICDWAEEAFKDTLVFTSVSRDTAKKYSGVVNIAKMLCQWLSYLDADAHFRVCEDPVQKEKYKDAAQWYKSMCTFERGAVGGSSDDHRYEADYTVSYEGAQVKLTEHLIKGNSSGALLRLYFKWMEDTGKYLIGGMTEHARTSSYS